MEHLLYGAPVAEAIREQNRIKAEELKRRGVCPTLAAVRIGERPETVSYIKGLLRQAEKSAVAVRQIELEETASQEEALTILDQLNEDGSIHGVLVLQPLPEELSGDALRNRIAPEKDVDAAGDLSLAGVFSGRRIGFAPATPEAVMALLAHYGIDPAGKHAVIVGRSLVAGRPLAMLLLGANATVTVCHSQTKDLPRLTRQADLVIAAMGKPRALGPQYFSEGQIVIDVGIHRTPDGLCGDVDFAAAEPLAAAITPVPGGIGAVTSAVMLSHVVEAAERQYPFAQ